MIGIGFVGFAVICGIIGGILYCIIFARRHAAKTAHENHDKTLEMSSIKTQGVYFSYKAIFKTVIEYS